MPTHISLLISLFIVGCASSTITQKPTYWPAEAEITNSDCSSFAGRYWDEGKPAPSNELPDSAVLSRKFNVFAEQPIRESRQVELSFPSKNILKIVIFSGGDKVGEGAVALEGSYACENGKLLRRLKLSGNSEGLSYKSDSTFSLSLASDGSLIGHNGLSSQKSYLLIPHASRTESWYLFRKVK